MVISFVYERTLIIQLIMHKIVFLLLSVACAASIVVPVSAQTGSDFLQAHKKTDCTIMFDVGGQGTEYKVNWGMDAAWNWDFNMRRGANWIGKEHLTIGRVAYQPGLLVTDNGDGTYELTAAQKRTLKSRCDNIRNLTGATMINFTADQEYYLDENHPEYRENYLGKWWEWFKCLKASVKYAQELGMTVYSVSPFNEPDYGDGYTWGWLEGNKNDFLQMCKWIREDPFFDGIRISGGNTLNCDQALPWYNVLKDYLDEGNTHQLAGSFDNYAKFFTQVRADGKVATADELHNVGEAIVGVQYGMQNGIWWGFDSRARGQFCIDSNEGVRLGYGEDRSHWTSGAVYRNDSTGEVHGYIGSSERQANPSSYRFVSTTKDVYFNGHGPMREYTYDLPGGTGYQQGQINAEYSFDVVWGADVPQAPVDGTYMICNYYSKKNMLTANGNGNVTCVGRKTSGTTQQWVVTPQAVDGDCSYWNIDNAGNSKLHLNLLNNNLASGAGVICWDAGHAMNEQWLLKYAGEGYWYIINRLSGMYLNYTGSAVNLVTAPAPNALSSVRKKCMWRFQPIDSKGEVVAPAVPTGLKATPLAGSIRLDWEAVEDDDPIVYNILRGEHGEWNTIGRGDTLCTFLDNTAVAGRTYSYKVVAVDYQGNRSEASQAVEAARLTGKKRLVMQQQFDGDLADKTANRLNASLAGTEKYSTVNTMIKSGSKSLNLTAQDSYVQLPCAMTHLDSMTIAMWVRWSGGDSWQRIFDFGNGTGQYMFLCPSNGSEMRFVMKNGGDEQILSAGSKLKTVSWHHLAVTIRPLPDGNVEATLYNDGEAIASSQAFTLKPSDIAASLCYVGRSQFDADPLFKGYIDDMRIYNYALSAEEIQKVMADTGDVSQYLDTSILGDEPTEAPITISDITTMIDRYLHSEEGIDISDITRLITRYLESNQ